MSKELFHSMSVACPTCGQKATITDVGFSVKGRIKLQLICVLCAKELTLTTSWDKVICFCAEKQAIMSATVFVGETMQ